MDVCPLNVFFQPAMAIYSFLCSTEIFGLTQSPSYTSVYVDCNLVVSNTKTTLTRPNLYKYSPVFSFSHFSSSFIFKYSVHPEAIFAYHIEQLSFCWWITSVPNINYWRGHHFCVNKSIQFLCIGNEISKINIGEQYNLQYLESDWRIWCLLKI